MCGKMQEIVFLLVENNECIKPFLTLPLRYSDGCFSPFFLPLFLLKHLHDF